MSKKIIISLFLTSCISSFASAQVLPQLKARLEDGRNAKLLVIGDSIVGGYGVIGILPDKGGCKIEENYHQDTWVYQLGKQIDLAYNRPSRASHLNVRIVNRKEQTKAISDGATRTPDVLEPDALMISQFYPWSPTLTLIRDGVGGSNVLRLLGRIQSIGRTPSGERVNEGAASNSDGVIVAVGINDSFDGIKPPPTMPVSPACPAFNLMDYLDGIGWRNLAVWGTSLADFQLGIDSVVDATFVQHSAPGFSTEIALATPIITAYNTADWSNVIKSYIGGTSRSYVRFLNLSQKYERLPDDTHPTPKGHIAIAKKVFEDMFLSGSSATILKNPSFESPSLDAMGMDFTYNKMGDSWSAGSGWIVSELEPGIGGAGITKNTVGGFAGATAAPASELRTGKQVALLQGDGKIGQNVYLVAGNPYHLRFIATQRITVGSGPQDIGVFLDGVQIGSTFRPPAGNYETRDFDLSVSVSGTHKIEIRGMTPRSGNTAFIDEVQLGLRSVAVPSNLSFEFPRLTTLGFDYKYEVLDDWDVMPTVSGKGGAGITKNATGGFTGATIPPNPALKTGDQVAFLQGSGWIKQKEMYLEPGYHIRFIATQRELTGPVSQSVGVYVDEILQGSVTPARGYYSSHDIAVTIPSAKKCTVRLSGMKEGSDVTSFVDDVRVGW